MDNSNSGRSGFLSLPQEIRDRIYYYTYRPVYIIVSSEPNQTHSISCDNFEQFRQPTRPSKQTRNSTPRLHEVCRQLHMEIQLSHLRHGTFVFYEIVDLATFLDDMDPEQRRALTRIAFHPSIFNGEGERLRDEAERIRKIMTEPVSSKSTGSVIASRLPNLKTITIFSRVRAALTLIQPCPPPWSSRMLLFLVTDEIVKQAYNGILPESRVPPSDRIYLYAQMLLRNHSIFYLQLKEKFENQVKVVMQEV